MDKIELWAIVKVKMVSDPFLLIKPMREMLDKIWLHAMAKFNGETKKKLKRRHWITISSAGGWGNNLITVFTLPPEAGR